MWHVVKLNNKRDRETAEKRLNLEGKGFYALEQLAQMHGAQAAIALQLRTHVPEGYLIEDWNDAEEATENREGYQQYFQRVRMKRGQKGHLQLTQEEFDQLVRVLQTPPHYRVLVARTLPEEELKEFTLPYGPLQGLKGRYLNRKTPRVKRFYVQVMKCFDIEIKVPIADIKAPSKEKGVALSYLSDDDTPHWYVLTTPRKEYLEHLTEGTLNHWVLRKRVEAVSTPLYASPAQPVKYTTRYVFRAIYRRYDNEGNPQEINLMPNYYFLRTTRYDLETFRGTGFDSHVYILRNANGTPVRVPEAQIEGFHRFLSERSEAAEAIFSEYREGDMARIAIGRETDNEVEGTVQIVTKKHVVIVSDNGFKIQVRKGTNRHD